MCAREESMRAVGQCNAQLVHIEQQSARNAAPLPSPQRPLRPVERPFTHAERSRVTLLIGGVTWKHEELIQAVFEAAGYRCERLPTPTFADFQTGKDYGNKGQCNPAYFTIGCLINHLRRLQQSGIPRQQIIRDYAHLTAGSCGPCRFGMYEDEYRLALQNAGFAGFRILLFQQTAGVQAAGTDTGLKTTVDFGMGLLNAVHLGDALHEMMYRIRPYEVTPGETDRVLRAADNALATMLRERRHWHLEGVTPTWLPGLLGLWPHGASALDTAGKIVHNLYGPEFVNAMENCREQIHSIQVDRLRVKPIVKTIGEFWAQTTEGDGNFNIFALLEREGAQVMPEPVGTWATYLLYFTFERARVLRTAGAAYRSRGRYDIRARASDEWQAVQKRIVLGGASLLWTHLYARALRHLGGLDHRPVSQQELARLAHPYLHRLFDGGEGYMEVGENIYYSSHHLCHMVLGLKPFGCMPSSQSDGVQSHIASCHKDMIYLPIETSGEGEVNAHSRVLMALAEAKAKARAEFERVLHSTGRSLQDLQEYVAEHDEMRHALYRFPRHEGIAGTAAHFAWHIHSRMTADTRIWRRTHAAISRVMSDNESGAGAPRAVSLSNAGPSQRDATNSSPGYLVGMDVGSTTVKAVVTNASSGEIVWQDYQRHETRQPEKVLEFLERIEREIGIATDNTRIFITGSGGQRLAELIGAKFVQEVHAVSLAVEEHHPDVYSVIELGGQDAKIVVFRDDEESGRKKRIPSMNDKCAGGTGAVIDKINAKLKIPEDELASLPYAGVKLHKVAGKCGVFAETDIIGLQKSGIEERELMASLFDAIVLQNLSVLTRGNMLYPRVLLLGGPNAFLRGLREAWQQNIARLWQERRVELPQGVSAASLIQVPPNALYFPALGAAAYGRDEPRETGRYAGTEKLKHYITYGRQQEKALSGVHALMESESELEQFLNRYCTQPFHPVEFAAETVVNGFIGIDGGSTSTKAVVLNERGDVLCKAYQLSNGNPIQDAIDLLAKLRSQVEKNGAELRVRGLATTGYAKDILKDVLQADVAIVETVAHTASALKFYRDPHVIVDVGGQDIKIIILKDGRVKDFRLNTQCSAGNGYFLQSTAEDFGVPLEQYADLAFSARSMPVFGYGCAVFLQSDIVNFQRQGWQRNEILAGLAAVLPKNIFLYVAGMPNLSALGTRFVLQGGTQRNLAVVKAEMDFIRKSFQGTGKTPEIHVHEHCGESGAIGAAHEAIKLWHDGASSSFIGFDAAARIRYRVTRNEDTRCVYCRNNCLRTFIDVSTAPPDANADGKRDEKRLIIASCEKGAAVNMDQMRSIKAGIEAVRKQNPNLVEVAVREAFRQREVESVADPQPARGGPFGSAESRHRAELRANRSKFRVGIPRVLNAYNFGPFFNGYFASLGIAPENIVYSDYTTPDLYREGASRGSIDPCYPSKIAIAHVHNLLHVKHRRVPLDAIFFPMYTTLQSPLVNITGAAACPTATATPEAVKAAFMKERNIFAENHVAYVEPMLDMQNEHICAYQMLQAWSSLLGLSPEENERAVTAGYRLLRKVDAEIQRQALATLNMLEREGRIGIVILGRSYHHDPGLNHQIPEEFQKLGYPVFSQSTLPLDEALLDRLFGAEVRAGYISHPLDIADVWKNRFSAGTNLKLWAAKFTARHPNLVAVEFSNFKCGHDAPAYKLVETIVEQSGTPYFCFKDLDENKPAGSIRLRIETIDYFLRNYRKEVIARRRPFESAEVEFAGINITGPRDGSQAAQTLG